MESPWEPAKWNEFTLRNDLSICRLKHALHAARGPRKKLSWLSTQSHMFFFATVNHRSE